MEQNKVPSLNDYQRFHGMFCGVATTQRVLQSFNGSALFASVNDYANDRKAIEEYYYSHPPVRLNMFIYYLLVLVSLTGISTAVGLTRWHVALDEGENEGAGLVMTKGITPTIASKSNPSLKIPTKVIEYLISRNNASQIKLIRRFEVDFAQYLSVVMFHF